MSYNPVYSFDYLTTSEDAVPVALQGSVYWYDIGSTVNSESIFYDTSNTYAYWYDSAQWVITLIADIDAPLVDYFSQTGSTLSGAGAFSGTLSIKTTLISDSWYRAETLAFESFAEFVNATENENCFRGFLPVMGDAEEDELVNVWQISSGGSSEFEITRVYGYNPNWCSLRADMQIESLWDSRELAMKFAGCVIAWLKSTQNMHETGNIQWVTLSDMPNEPEIYRTDGSNRQRFWRQTIDLELVYATEGNYN